MITQQRPGTGAHLTRAGWAFVRWPWSCPQAERQRQPPWRKGSSKPSEAGRPEKKGLSQLIACPAEKSCGHLTRFEKGVQTGSWGHERPR